MKIRIKTTNNNSNNLIQFILKNNHLNIDNILTVITK